MEALGLLDPTHRALLELSLHREVADPALAELLRTDADTVVRQRADALQRLGDVLDTPPAEVEDALIGHWRGEPEPEAEEEAGEPADEEPVQEEAEPAEEEAEPEKAGEAWTPADAVTPGEAERPRRRGFWAALTALAAIGLVLVLVLGGGGDDDEPESSNGGSPPAEPGDGGDAPPAEPGAEPVELEAVFGGGSAGGTARIVERDGAQRLELRLRGLSGDAHAVWLYNSIGDARRLATARGPSPFVNAPLPEGYERFRYIDVSQEPDDGNPNHSGASVLRAPTSELTAG